MPSESPHFSIVIPTYSRAERLRACLDSVVALDYPRDGLEVIAVDDGGLPAAAAVAASFRDQIGMQCLRQENRGPATARNLGAAHARGSFLVFIDDDCVMSPDLLRLIERQLEQTPNALIGVRVDNALASNPYATTTQLISTYACEMAEGVAVEGGQRFTSSLLAGSRAVFDEIGGFDGSFRLTGGEDYEFCLRWQCHGHTAVYLRDAIVYHSHSLTLISFVQQHFRYGRGLLRCHRNVARYAPKHAGARHISFYIGLMRYPLLQGLGAQGWHCAALVLVSQMASAAGALWEHALEWRRSSIAGATSPEAGRARP